MMLSMRRALNVVSHDTVKYRLFYVPLLHVPACPHHYQRPTSWPSWVPAHLGMHKRRGALNVLQHDTLMLPGSDACSFNHLVYSHVKK